MAKYSTPGVYLKEIDKSEVFLTPGAGGAAIALKSPTGPTWRPLTLSNTTQLNGVFGYPALPQLADMPAGTEYSAYLQEPPVYGYGLYAAAAYLAEGTNLTVVRGCDGTPVDLGDRTVIQEYVYSTATFGLRNETEFWGAAVKGQDIPTDAGSVHVGINEIHDQSKPNTASKVYAIDYSMKSNWAAKMDAVPQTENDSFVSNFGLAFFGGPSAQGDNVAARVLFFGKEAPWRYKYDDDAKIDQLLKMITAWETKKPLANIDITVEAINEFIDTNKLIAPKMFRIEVYVKPIGEDWKKPINSSRYSVMEVFDCSLDGWAKDINGGSVWLPDVVNGKSSYIYAKYNQMMTTAQITQLYLKDTGSYIMVGTSAGSTLPTKYAKVAPSIIPTYTQDLDPANQLFTGFDLTDPAGLQDFEDAVLGLDEKQEFKATVSLSGTIVTAAHYNVLVGPDAAVLVNYIASETPNAEVATKAQDILDRSAYIMNEYEISFANRRAITGMYNATYLTNAGSLANTELKSTLLTTTLELPRNVTRLADLETANLTTAAGVVAFETLIKDFDVSTIYYYIVNGEVAYNFLNDVSVENLGTYLTLTPADVTGTWVPDMTAAEQATMILEVNADVLSTATSQEGAKRFYYTAADAADETVAFDTFKTELAAYDVNTITTKTDSISGFNMLQYSKLYSGQADGFYTPALEADAVTLQTFISDPKLKAMTVTETSPANAATNVKLKTGDKVYIECENEIKSYDFTKITLSSGTFNSVGVIVNKNVISLPILTEPTTGNVTLTVAIDAFTDKEDATNAAQTTYTFAVNNTTGVAPTAIAGTADTVVTPFTLSGATSSPVASAATVKLANADVISLDFNNPIKIVTPLAITCTQGATIIPCTISSEVNVLKVTITDITDVVDGAFTITIPSGAVSDIANNTAAFTHTFTIVQATGTTPVSITADTWIASDVDTTSPAESATNVRLNVGDKVYIEWNHEVKAIDVDKITTTGFTFDTTSVTVDNNVVVLTVDANATAGAKTVVFAINAVTDALGNKNLGAFTLTFTGSGDAIAPSQIVGIGDIDYTDLLVKAQSIITRNTDVLAAKVTTQAAYNAAETVYVSNVGGAGRSWTNWQTTGVAQQLTGGAEPESDSDIKSVSGWSLLENSEKVVTSLLLVPTYDMDVKMKINEVTIPARKRDVMMVAQSGSILDNDPKSELNTVALIKESELFGYPNPSYCALYCGWALTYDFYNDRDVWLPNSVFAGQAIARTDNIGNVWDAPAGQRKGIIPAKAQLTDFSDTSIGNLYDSNINACKEFAGIGSVIWGQKTAQRKPTALDRINVRRTLLFIERAIKLFLNPLVLDVNNTPDVRLRVWTQINNFLQGLKSQNGLIDYQVICDESNNPPEVIDANTLNVDVIVRPVKTIEFIDVNVIVASTGLSFEEARVR